MVRTDVSTQSAGIREHVQDLLEYAVVVSLIAIAAFKVITGTHTGAPAALDRIPMGSK